MESTWTGRFAWYSQGQGILEVDPPRGVRVEWSAVQSATGNAFIAVRPLPEEALAADIELLVQLVQAPNIVGFDTAQHAVRASTSARTNPVDAADLDAGWITFRVNEFESIARASTVTSFRFALSNISQEGPPHASWIAEGVELSVTPAPTFEDMVSTLGTRDRYGHTANLSVATDNREHAVQLAEITCALLSLIVGCRVSWLHLVGLDVSGAAVHAWLSNAITGPFMNLLLLLVEN